MAEISYYDADLSDAIMKLNELMGKVAKAPPGVRPEVRHRVAAVTSFAKKVNALVLCRFSRWLK